MEKQNFQSWKRKYILSFFDMQKDGKYVKRWCLTPKQMSWWKKSILTKRSTLSYHTNGLKVFVDVMEHPFEEKLTQLKSHQQLYVGLIRGQKRNFYT